MYLSIALVIATSTLFLYCASVFFAGARLRTLISAVLWGIAAFAVAFAAHETLLSLHVLELTHARLISAPLLEEMLKALPLVILVLRARFSQTGSEALYGFGMGIGFATLETVMYITTDPINALGIAAARVITVNLMHGISTAMIGATSTTRTRGIRYFLWLALAFAAAVGTHAGFNFLMHTLADLRLPVALAISVSGVLIVVFFTRKTTGAQPALAAQK